MGRIAIKEDEACYASGMQQEVLGTLSGLEIVGNNFFITGGTALAVFWLHHRTSEDIDLFSTEFRDLGTVDAVLKTIFRDDLTVIQSSPEFYSYLIKQIKVDLVFDALSTNEKRPAASLKMGEEIFIDTLHSIAANKLSATVSRFEAKDLIDFYFISKIVWRGLNQGDFLACYDMAGKKEALLDDPAMAAYQMEELLEQVLSKKEKIIPPMRKSVDWNSFEEEIRFYIDIVYRMGKW